MKKHTLTTLGLHVATTLLFYHEDPGLNYLILHVLILIWLLITDRDTRTSHNFFGLTMLMTTIAGGVFSSGSTALAVIYMLLLPYWVLSSRYPVEHLLLMPITSLIRVPMALVRWFSSIRAVTWRFQGNLHQLVINGMGIAVAIGLLLIFGQFYTGANDVFSDYYGRLTNWIALDSVSTFMGFQLWMQLAMRNASTKRDRVSKLNRRLMGGITNWLESIAEYINPDYFQVAFNFLRIGLLVLLSGLLAAEVYSFLQPVQPTTVQEYSTEVHKTFDGMLASFVLTILVLGIERYFVHFRRAFTRFEGGTYNVIIVLNLVMIGITAYKDYLYIASSALTERRLELLVWLLWATVLMLIILLSDQRKAQMKVLLDRMVLASLTCMMLNAGLPYEHLVLLSYAQNNMTNEIDHVLDPDRHWFYTPPLSWKVNGVALDLIRGEELSYNQEQREQVMKTVTLPYQQQSFNLKMWLEHEIVAELVTTYGHKKVKME